MVRVAYLPKGKKRHNNLLLREAVSHLSERLPIIQSSMPTYALGGVQRTLTTCRRRVGRSFIDRQHPSYYGRRGRGDAGIRTIRARASFAASGPTSFLSQTIRTRDRQGCVEMLDLGKIYAEYAEEGSPPYHPQMMLKVLFHSYHCGLMRSRKIWDGLKERADLIFLSGDQVPNFRTINDFRTRHMKVLPKLFAQIVMICVRLGMLDFQNLAVDGEKIKASANYRRSKNRKRTKQSYQRVKEAVARVLARPVNEDFTEAKKVARLERLQGQKKDLPALKRMLEDMEDKEATEQEKDRG